MHPSKLMDMIRFIQMIMVRPVHEDVDFPNEDVDDSGEQDDDDGMNDPPVDPLEDHSFRHHHLIHLRRILQL